MVVKESVASKNFGEKVILTRSDTCLKRSVSITGDKTYMKTISNK